MKTSGESGIQTVCVSAVPASAALAFAIYRSTFEAIARGSLRFNLMRNNLLI